MKVPLIGGLMDFMMLILGWFTITVEVFLRRDFGERYLSKLNAIIGFLVFAVLTIGFGMISTIFQQMTSSLRGQGAGVPDGFSGVMFFLWLAYTVICLLHFARIEWREAINQPLHSLAWGRSWLLPIGAVATAFINRVLLVLIRFNGRFQKGHERERLPDDYEALNDKDEVTERLVEPFFLFVVAFFFAGLFDSSIPAIWLYFTSFALLLYSNWRYYAMRQQILDIRDQMIESTHIRAAVSNAGSDRMRITGSTKRSLQLLGTELETHPEEAQRVMGEDDNISKALAALNPKLQQMQEANRAAHNGQMVQHQPKE